ncbi:hypothetical protein O181_098691 [Austropuccinia psidii MF-1]|uniref:Uncharacterized protein n=1 Tax=Austropuccinia psidii MF-1 TaxID=1389203 RepID=A0A9Q3JBW8_9BASI|nr:hypothetical protein [Austropuccinia psidii MF-1]
MFNHPSIGVSGKSSLTPFYGQLAMSSVLWPIGPFLCFIAFGPYNLSLAPYGLRPYPSTIGPYGQLSTSPTPWPIPFFWAWGIHPVFQGLLDPQYITRAFRPTPLIMVSKA